MFDVELTVSLYGTQEAELAANESSRVSCFEGRRANGSQAEKNRQPSACVGFTRRGDMYHVIRFWLNQSGRAMLCRIATSLMPK